MSDYSGIILAGGDGTRLASLTRRLAGDGRPKQFCRVLAVLPVSGFSWTDLGDPERVHDAQARLGWQSAMA